MWWRWPDEREAGQAASDFKAVTIPALISLEEEQSLNLSPRAN